MNSEQIIKNILKGSSYENMQEIYTAYGIDKVEFAIKECEANGLKVPHMIMDVRGPLKFNESKNIIQSIEATSDYNAKQALIRAYGTKRVQSAIVDMGGAKNVKHIVFDALGPVLVENAKKIISSIENNGTYEDKQEIAKAYGIDETNQAIKTLGGYKNGKVKHIVADVMGPLNHSNDETQTK